MIHKCSRGHWDTVAGYVTFIAALHRVLIGQCVLWGDKSLAS